MLKMKGKELFRVAIVIILTFGISGINQAQDLNEATNAYNSALPLIKTDPTAAIKSLNTCIDLCNKLGEAGDSVKIAAQDKLPGAYFNLGTNQATNKEIAKAIETFQEAAKYSKQYNTPEVLERSNSALARLYYMQANAQMNQKDLVKAQESINQALQLEPENATAWLVQSYIFKEGNNDAEFEAAIDKCIAFAKNANESRQAQQAALKYFLAKGSKAVNASKFDEGMISCEKAQKYDSTSKDVLFYLSKAYNGLEKWDLALETANKGLAIEEDVPEKKAKFYFELGTAQKGKGDKAGACESFQNSMFGQFSESAKYEIEVVLKCGK